MVGVGFGYGRIGASLPAHSPVLQHTYFHMLTIVHNTQCPAGTNDHEFAERTGHGRDINRHHYTIEEAEAAVQQPVVQVGVMADKAAVCLA